MQAPITINESSWLRGPYDEIRHAFRHHGTPLVISCRFWDVHRTAFPEPREFVHTTVLVTRVFVPINGGARIRAAGREYDLRDDRFYLLPEGMPFETRYQCEALYALHLQVSDGTGGALFDPAEGVRELCDDSLREAFIAAVAGFDAPLAQALGFAALRRFVAPQLDRIAARHARTERFRAVIAEVERNPTAELTVERLAALACLSPSAASKGFRRSTGIGLKRFALDRLTLRAKELLTYTDMTIAEVAERLGYAELSYFSRAFKREAGMPPAAYRVASRANDGSRQAR